MHNKHLLNKRQMCCFFPFDFEKEVLKKGGNRGAPLFFSAKALRPPLTCLFRSRLYPRHGVPHLAAHHPVPLLPFALGQLIQRDTGTGGAGEHEELIECQHVNMVLPPLLPRW